MIYVIQKLIILKTIRESTGTLFTIGVSVTYLLLSMAMVVSLHIPFCKLTSLRRIHEFVHDHWIAEDNQF